MKKIHMIITGGTIGSIADENGVVAPNNNMSNVLLSAYGKELDRFRLTNPYSISSNDLSFKNWVSLCEKIDFAIKDNADAIIVTHGTDTLAYTAPFLSLIYSNVSVPIIILGSNKPINEEGSNALDNFMAAMAIIEQTNLKGVFTPFKNCDENFVSIHLGNQILMPSPLSENFHSVNNKFFGKFYEDKLEILQDNPFESAVQNNYEIKFNKEINFLTSYVGSAWENVLNDKNQIILLELFHSGTAKIIEKGILDFKKFNERNNNIFYVCNIDKNKMYNDSTVAFMDAGIKPMYNMPANVALVKLIVAYNCLVDFEPERFLNTNISGEVLNL